MTEKVIPIDQPDLVRRVTVTGFVSTDGHFYGDDERLARYASCTHVRCDCGTLVHKGWMACDACREKKDIERYAALPKVEWNGDGFIYSDACDRYFQSYEEVVDYLRDAIADDPEFTVESLRLMICEPNMAREIDGNEHFSDDLPEDGEIPPELEAAFEALNAVIRKQPPLSWSPGKNAAIVTIDPADLAEVA
ncbi:hypothetical protein [Paraburkholderia unamae]|uniref:Uncharacterized protein n=1 Tax=Paraburkholderia unamae TaxID=219649 RepID=A0ABX5KTK7_9BURK|nr:hypothetical protein [Paraburkholderia unamae]PVX86438.1 hypothetical protein C7402_102274 [Paraburkholderia unamae]